MMTRGQDQVYGMGWFNVHNDPMHTQWMLVAQVILLLYSKTSQKRKTELYAFIICCWQINPCNRIGPVVLASILFFPFSSLKTLEGETTTKAWFHQN